MGDSGRRKRRGKVERLVDQCGLEDIGDELERRWTAQGEDRRSPRELADYFNRRLVEAALVDGDAWSFARDSEQLYRQLSADDTSRASRT